MKKVSVIIPNYNGERYVLDCLDSVAMQDYPNIEVIVVDDGSSDDSVGKIRDYIALHNNNHIKLICQGNLNGAIARNNGMRIATGDYVLFLDSDDLLENNAISFMVNVCEQDGTDLVIGGYKIIDEGGMSTCDKKNTGKASIVDFKESFEELINMDPVPSNKLYRLDLIKEKGLEWGNVRIGQDLNFYLKYLLLCTRISIVKKSIYKYRICRNSMTRTYDLRIFDISNSFSDVERFYNKCGKGLLYKRFMPFQILRHFNYQMGKMIYYKDRRIRDLIVRFFSVNERRLDYSLCRHDDKGLRKLRLKFRVKCFLRPLFISGFYCLYKIKTEKEKNNG